MKHIRTFKDIKLGKYYMCVKHKTGARFERQNDYLYIFKRVKDGFECIYALQVIIQQWYKMVQTKLFETTNMKDFEEYYEYPEMDVYPEKEHVFELDDMDMANLILERV